MYNGAVKSYTPPSNNGGIGDGDNISESRVFPETFRTALGVDDDGTRHVIVESLVGNQWQQIGRFGSFETDKFLTNEMMGGFRYKHHSHKQDSGVAAEYFMLRMSSGGDGTSVICGNYDGDTNYLATGAGGWQIVSKTEEDISLETGDKQGNYESFTDFTVTTLLEGNMIMSTMDVECEEDISEVGFNTTIISSDLTTVFSKHQKQQTYDALSDENQRFKFDFVAGTNVLPLSQPFPLGSGETVTIRYQFKKPVKLRTNNDGSVWGHLRGKTLTVEQVATREWVESNGGITLPSDAEIKTAYENNTDTNAFTDAEKAKLSGIEDSATIGGTAPTGTEIKALYEGNANTNAFTDIQKDKLDGIEENATADQTDEEIKSAYENNADTNAYTDAERTKLASIEVGATAGNGDGTAPTDAEIKAAYERNDDTNVLTDDEKVALIKLVDIEENATADQTGEEIKAAYESVADTNVFTDIQKAKLAGIEENATAGSGTTLTSTEIKTLYESNDSTNVFTDALLIKLGAIEPNATVDQTSEEIKTGYESNANTNAFTDTEKTKLTGIEVDATADQTNEEIKTAYESNANTNTFTDANMAKLAGIEEGATAGGGGGGTLTSTEIKTLYENNTDTNAFTDAEKAKLVGIEDNATAGGTAPTDAEIKISYENNADTNAYTDSEKTKLTGVEDSADVTGTDNVAAAGAVMSTGTDISQCSWVLDDDDMTANDETKVPTQQSVKAYVDANLIDLSTSNLMVGSHTMDLMTGSISTGLGHMVLENNTTGSANTAVGRSAMRFNTTGTQNVAVGNNVLYNNATGKYNTAVGYVALKDNTGDENTAVGRTSLYKNTTGNRNVGVGQSALNNNTEGNDNVAVGNLALSSSINGTGSVAVGGQALEHATGGMNTAVGYFALKATTAGAGNVGVGARALEVCTEGYHNVAVGNRALTKNLIGMYNIGIGFKALSGVNTGENNIGIGKSALYNVTTGKNNIGIGYYAKAPAAGTNNSITLGDNSITTLRCSEQTISALSDERDKTNIVDSSLGLAYINKLRPVEFEWDYRQEHYIDGKAPSKQGTKDVGFIAQELKEVQDEADAAHLNSYQHYPKELNVDGKPLEGTLGIDVMEASYGSLLPVMAQAIKELSDEIDSLKQQLKSNSKTESKTK